ncbi:MAG: hypothetical protein R3A51_07725 [Nannocystaceae bacterium]
MGPTEFRERVAALKHDLGKYVAWMSANFPADAWEPPLEDAVLDALQRDLLATRRRADGTPEAAWEVWERLSGDLERPLADELARVADAVSALRSIEPSLRARDRAALADHAPAIQEAQRTIRDELRALQRRLTRG